MSMNKVNAPCNERDEKAFGKQFCAMRQEIEKALDAAIQDDDKAAEPCRALLFSGGKRWRPLLLLLCAQAARSEHKNGGGIAEKDVYSLCPLVEFPHTASLIHDDIEDGAAARRGKPCAHLTYGVDAAINAACYLYFLATQCIQSAPLSDAVKCRLYAMYDEELRLLHRGQALDIAWHNESGFFPAVAEYEKMTAMKTGALASLAARAGALAGGLDGKTADELGQAAVTLGTGFQALDDARNIEEGNPGKDMGDDIVEGKKSLPVLLHLEEHSGDKDRIIKLFCRAKEEGISSDAVKEGLDMLNKSGAAKKAREHGKHLVEKAKEVLNTPLLTAFIDDLLEACNA